MNRFDKLEKEFQSIHSELDKNLPEGIIYHYTSCKGLENILKERKLRYTDYRCLNDPTELQYGKNIIFEALSNSDGITKKEKETTIKFFNNLSELWKVYVACFTTEVKKLALWRYYASNGTGFAIGFNKKFYQVDSTSNNKGKGVICKVIYGDVESNSIVHRFIQKYLHHQNKCSYERLMCNLLSILPSLKDESFSDEHEVRIFYNEGKLILYGGGGAPYYFENQLKETEPIQENHLRFVKPKLEKNFLKPEEFSAMAISEIWVGPSCEFSEARYYIEKLLKDEGYGINKIEILQSELPFRDN